MAGHNTPTVNRSKVETLDETPFSERDTLDSESADDSAGNCGKHHWFHRRENNGALLANPAPAGTETAEQSQVQYLLVDIQGVVIPL